MDEQTFLSFCSKQEYKQENINLFKLALDFAELHLKNKQRLSGDSYYDHNLRTAYILIETKSAPEIIIASILNGTEKGQESEITKRFNKEIISLLHEVQELKTLKLKNHNLEAESLRKIFLTTLKDVRAILIKLAGKLDNKYHEIFNFLEQTSDEQQKYLEQIIKLIEQLSKNKINILKIKGRPKHIYSIYKKMIDRGVNLHEQYDLLGIRIIVPEEKDCYTMLGLLHENFEPMQGRLKDYIATPKDNLYRSIHTGVKLLNGKIAEIQIRTPEMDEFAEEGLAAHWRYKKVKSSELFEKKIAWLRNVLELHKDNKELMETIKVDIFGDTINCYTPKGDIKELPKNSTLLDFAYLIHQHIGDHCIGGNVNGKFAALKHILQSGDVIEIITNKNQHPRRTWLKIVHSPQAKQKIRKALREYEKLPVLHYRAPKPLINEEQGTLVISQEYSNAFCTLAKCCQPIPDEPIVGIATKRRIISVHKIECRLALKEQERWINVQWKETFNQKISFIINAEERSGILADLLHTIASAGFEIKEAKAKMLDQNLAQCLFLVIPRDLQELKEMIKRVKKVKGIKRIYFE
ncbi:bifunctional (p)ppGpp synthetase/guanosine-3',5'-bis(diphosphate) 3'-pyrophosphohydrolase [Candidatus Woesearchaeota archaeon]|nr:bifunctional (p)ppGpp synthetase/guanosine-3',5'-bis(diphosphate) 3'-pyrophosphohydrolase [Candidatus Woesearchaeota archaeon]